MIRQAALGIEDLAIKSLPVPITTFEISNFTVFFMVFTNFPWFIPIPKRDERDVS